MLAEELARAAAVRSNLKRAALSSSGEKGGGGTRFPDFWRRCNFIGPADAGRTGGFRGRCDWNEEDGIGELKGTGTTAGAAGAVGSATEMALEGELPPGDVFVNEEEEGDSNRPMLNARSPSESSAVAEEIAAAKNACSCISRSHGMVPSCSDFASFESEEGMFIQANEEAGVSSSRELINPSRVELRRCVVGVVVSSGEVD